MKIVNRGYIIVKGKTPFVNWVNEQEEEFFIDEETEPNIYLIEEDFFEIEPLIKENFKKIFLNELHAISDGEDKYPEIKLEVFLDWFALEVGSSVFDAQSKDLTAN